MMNEAVHAVLKDLGKHHPEYDAKAGHEMAGFVWFQGFNDQFSDAFRDNYKGNMIHFIKDVRKEYKTPKMPFVIGVMGTSIYKEKVAENKVSVAQREAAKAPEFKGNVASVDSYLYYAVDAYDLFKKGWSSTCTSPRSSAATAPTTIWAAASSSSASETCWPRRWPTC